MLRNICLKLVKVAAVVICIGTATSACWDHERGYGGRYGDHGDYRDGHHDERR
jgi:hypothetical protein